LLSLTTIALGRPAARDTVMVREVRGNDYNYEGAARHATSHWGVPVRGVRCERPAEPFSQRAAAGEGHPAGSPGRFIYIYYSMLRKIAVF
jgi:hypothetical protein